MSKPHYQRKLFVNCTLTTICAGVLGITITNAEGAVACSVTRAWIRSLTWTSNILFRKILAKNRSLKGDGTYDRARNPHSRSCKSLQPCCCILYRRISLHKISPNNSSLIWIRPPPFFFFFLNGTYRMEFVYSLVCKKRTFH